VLIVEDDKSARRAISAILRRQGYAVSESATLADAARGVADRPDWILLDLMLPDGCGIDLIKKIRAERLASRVCIITGCGADMIQQARAAGAEHALTKPLDVDRLANVLAG
jgi:DNA-binding response OmpR family regulator